MQLRCIYVHYIDHIYTSQLLHPLFLKKMKKSLPCTYTKHKKRNLHNDVEIFTFNIIYGNTNDR